MMIDRLFNRELQERLDYSPGVVLLGARQVGKSTLARAWAAQSSNAVFLDLELPEDRARLDQASAFFAAAERDEVAEKAAAYSRDLYDIASGTGPEFGKAFEGQAADAQKQFAGLVDNATKNAPAGSETAVAVMKSAVAAANNAFESVQKAVKQATDVAEANFNAVATTAATAGKTAAKKR